MLHGYGGRRGKWRALGGSASILFLVMRQRRPPILGERLFLGERENKGRREAHRRETGRADWIQSMVKNKARAIWSFQRAVKRKRGGKSEK
jgi:hypothetical protein